MINNVCLILDWWCIFDSILVRVIPVSERNNIYKSVSMVFVLIFMLLLNELKKIK